MAPGGWPVMLLMSSPGHALWQDLGCLTPPDRGGGDVRRGDSACSVCRRRRREEISWLTDCSEEPRTMRASRSRRLSLASRSNVRSMWSAQSKVPVAGVGDRERERLGRPEECLRRSRSRFCSAVSSASGMSARAARSCRVCRRE